ncbi:TolC family protein [bacterium]|nr:TolC family protein [bacterium]
MKRVFVLSFLAMFLYSQVLFAEEVTGDKKITIDLQTTIQKALQASEALKEADGEILMSEGKRMKARAGYAPQIEVAYSYNKMDEDRRIYTSFSEDLAMLLQDLVIRQMYLTAFSPYSDNFPPYQKDWSDPANSPEMGFVTYILPEEFALLQVDFMMPIWTWWKLPGLNKMAKAGVNVALEKKRQTRAEVICDSGSMYFQSLYVRYAKEIVNDTLLRLQATYDLSVNIFEGGTGKVTKTDLIKAKIGLSRAEFKAAEAERGWFLAQEALKRSMGLEEYELDFINKEIFYKKAVLDLEQLIETMLKNRPEWKQANYGLIAKEANSKVALSEMLPMIALLGEYKSYSLLNTSCEDELNETVGYADIDDYPNPYDDLDEWRVTLAAKVPLSFWSNYGDYKEAQGEAAMMRAKKEWARNSLVLQVKKIYAELNENLKKIEISQKIMTDAQEHYDLMYKSFQVGMAELGDVIESQIESALYKQQYNESVLAYNLSCLELNKIVGTDVIMWD